MAGAILTGGVDCLHLFPRHDPASLFESRRGSPKTRCSRPAKGDFLAGGCRRRRAVCAGALRPLGRTELGEFRMAVDAAIRARDAARPGNAAHHRVFTDAALPRGTNETAYLPLPSLSRTLSTKEAEFWSYLKIEIVPSLIFSTTSSITNSGTRNHSRGTTGCPKRSLISISRRAGPKMRWIRFSSLVRLMLYSS
jgi:hypothetical protein